MKPRNGKLGFGKHADKDIRDVPLEYLNWLAKSSREQLERIKTEITRREASEEEALTWKERIIKAGYRELVKRHHPDHGWNKSDAQQLNAAYETLWGGR